MSYFFLTKKIQLAFDNPDLAFMQRIKTTTHQAKNQIFLIIGREAIRDQRFVLIVE